MPDVSQQRSTVRQSSMPAPLEGEIREHLAKVLSSPSFDATPRMRKFLTFVVDMTMAGRPDELKAYTIAREVYGRPPEFNPAEDTVVRIQAGRLRRALDMYYLTDGKDDSLRIDIPKGTYVPVFLPQTEPASVSFETSVINSEPAHQVRPEPSIAVLPFTNLTGDPEREYFAAGLTEEITIELTHYEDFHVVGYRPPHGLMDLSSAAFRELGVRFLVEGTLRMSEQMLKIGIRLTDTKGGELLWGEQYQCDVTATGLFELQENISREVVARIAGEFGIIPTRMTLESKGKAPNQLTTYEAMLRAYHFHRVLSREAFQDAFSCLQSSVEREPDFAMTLAMLADLYLTSYSLDIPGIEQPLAHGAALIERAEALDPTNQFVQLVVAILHFVQNDRELFFDAAERALSLNRNSGLRVGAVGFYLCLCGEWDRGMPLLEKSMQVHHTYPNWFHGPIVLFHYRRKRYQRAYEEALKFSMPHNFWGPMLRVAALGQLQRASEAQGDSAAVLALRPHFQERGVHLIRRYVKEEDLASHIIDGLNKGGLRLPHA